LATVSKPAAFGFLYLMTWFITQSGYLLALLGRERPVPSENVPRAWSRQMISAALKDKAFMRVMAFMVISTLFISPIFLTFVSTYGFKELKMQAALSAVIALVGQIVRIVSCAGIGVLTDRMTPKRILPYWMFVAFVALLPVIFIKNAMGVYISAAIAALHLAGLMAACNALIYGIPKPENRSGHYTIQLILQYLATSAGMIMMGWLCDVLGYRTVFIAFAFVSLLMVPVTKWLLSILSDDVKSYA
ncbi:MAG: MFS transporter, partial [Armatimonadota bacterium]